MRSVCANLPRRAIGTFRRRAGGPRCSRGSERGIVLLALLLVLALGGITLMAAVDVWQITRQREREVELLFAGDQYRQAIRAYYFAAPSPSQRSFPPSVAALLDDERFLTPVHHLRRAYPDPVTGQADWGLVRLGEGIVGVYSTSDKAPLKQAGFTQPYQHFNEQSAYSHWVFAFVPPRSGATTPAASNGRPPTASTRPALPVRPNAKP